MDPNRYRTMNRRVVTVVRAAGLAALLLALPAGCTPKRVVQGRVETADHAPRQEASPNATPANDISVPAARIHAAEPFNSITPVEPKKSVSAG